ncbi:hypothetical protein AB0M11_01825 [Streptomyces sp. NPDC051987]|uniref:hypothetical protein n=1 Tax=Streptomyces sp. NPDC051987 TaxID=3155808 RepID=UPI0034165CA2
MAESSPSATSPAQAGAGTPTSAPTQEEPAAARAEDPAAALAVSMPEGDGPAPGDTAAVGRPGRPLLAGAAVLGALLIAVPGLLMSRDRTPENHDRVVADQAGTVLGGGAPQDAGAYASSSPSAPARSAPETSPHRSPRAKTSAVQPVSEPTPAKTKAKRPAAPPKPKKTTTSLSQPPGC